MSALLLGQSQQLRDGEVLVGGGNALHLACSGFRRPRKYYSDYTTNVPFVHGGCRRERLHTVTHGRRKWRIPSSYRLLTILESRGLLPQRLQREDTAPPIIQFAKHRKFQLSTVGIRVAAAYFGNQKSPLQLLLFKSFSH
jgi:hypothetical protein